MTSDEVKKAFENGTPVTLDGVRYAGISAIIYRHINGATRLTVELTDYGKNSVTIALAKDVKSIYDTKEGDT